MLKGHHHVSDIGVRVAGGRAPSPARESESDQESTGKPGGSLVASIGTKNVFVRGDPYRVDRLLAHR